MLKVNVLVLLLSISLSCKLFWVVSAETIQPLLFSDCDNATAEAASVDMNSYINSLIPKTNPGSGYVNPGYRVSQSNINYYVHHWRGRALREAPVADVQENELTGDRDLEERSLRFSTCPTSCNKHPNIPVCIALNCVTGGGRRREQYSNNYYQGQYFSLNSLIQKMNIKAGQLSLTYGCQIALFIDTIDG